MKKFPLWISATIICCIVGLAAVIFWTLSKPIAEIGKPPQFCLAKKFPGRAVSIDDLKPQDYTPFEDLKLSTNSKRVTDFYSAFGEDFFEKDKFYDGKAFPKIAMAGELYRFFWLRTFHNPVVIRVYRIGNEKFIVSKKTDGMGGYDYGKLIFNQSRKLSDSEWCEFIGLLEKADFWNKKKVDVNKLANDGAMWDVEGVREKRYYMAGEQSPKQSEFRDACIYLMRISGLHIDENAWEFY